MSAGPSRKAAATGSRDQLSLAEPASSPLEVADATAAAPLLNVQSPPLAAPAPPPPRQAEPVVSTLSEDEKQLAEKRRSKKDPLNLGGIALTNDPQELSRAAAARVAREQFNVLMAPPRAPAQTEAEERSQARRRNASIRLVPVRHAGLNGRETVIYTNRPPREP